jgi:predicted ATP-binding protein involved in virulence
MIQFIVSTHSPLVISSVESNSNNVVYKLNYDSETGQYTHEELNTYGLDASTIIKCYMDESSRDLNVERMIKNIEDLIDEKKYAEAKESLLELQDRTSTQDPKFSYLSSMISFAEAEI